jgi:hypothetical protein
MTIRREKCPGCPLRGDDRPCVGQNNGRACDLILSTSPDHIPGFDPVLRPPSMPSKIVEFIGAAAVHLFSGQPVVTPEIKAARLAICATCENHRDGHCQACGCPDSGLEVKAGWAEQRCPLEPPRWGPVEVT